MKLLLLLSLKINLLLSGNIFVDSKVEYPSGLESHIASPSHTYQLYSHGRSGELFLNGKWKNAPEIAKFLQLKIENSKLKIQNLNVYGCEFAKGQKGLEAVAYLQKTLGVSVSASTNITGIDGDWNLEVGKAKDVIALNNYKGNLQAACPNGTLNSNQYATVSTTGSYDASTVNTQNGSAGAPNGVYQTVYNTLASQNVFLNYANPFLTGDSLKITAKWYDSVTYKDDLEIAYSTDGYYWSTYTAVNGFNATSFSTVKVPIPASAVGAKYIRVGGKSGYTLTYLDAIQVGQNRCLNPSVSGVAYVDNGTGGGTSKNCVKDGTESGSAFSTGTYVKIKTVGGLSAISATALNADGTYSIPDVANGTYVVYLDNNNNLTDFTPTYPTNYIGVISQTVTITNGVASPAINFCLTFSNNVNGACPSVAITPTAASSSSHYGSSTASQTIQGLAMTGTGLAATKTKYWNLSSGLLLAENATSGWIDYTFTATSLNQVALWATDNYYWTTGDAPLKDFQVQVTSDVGVWTSGVFTTANPGLATNVNAQIFDLGNQFTNVTDVKIIILNGWYDTNDTGVTYVPANTKTNFGTYNMTLGEFRGVQQTCCNAGSTAPTHGATLNNVCPATTANLSTFATSACPAGSSLEWHTSTTVSAATLYATPTAATAGTYFATCHDATNNCYSPASTGVVVTINPLPSSPTIGTITQPTCTTATGSVILNSLPATGTWTIASNPAGYGATGSGTSKTISSLPAGNSYTFTVTNASGCTSVASASAVINAQPANPTPPVLSPATICTGNSTVLTASTNCTNSAVLTWYSDAGLTTTLASTTVSPPSTTTYYATCVLGSCKSTTASVIISVVTPPTAPTATPSTICSGGTATLSATCSAGTLTWYSDSGLSTVISSTPTALTTTTYYGACLTASCKSAGTPVTVTVGTISAPTSLSASKTTICSGSTDLTGICATGTLVWYNNANFTAPALSSATVSPITTSSYYASCESGACKLTNNSPVVITVVACPVASNDASTYTPGTTKTIGVTGNDTGGSTVVPSTLALTTTGLPNGSTLNADGSVTVPDEGTWTHDVSGNVSFTPISGYTGNPTPITYTVKDAAGNSTSATVTLTASPLYVTLIDFNAQKEEHAIKIVWTTAEEINADKFEVMRSADAKLFENIGTVIAKGNSQSKLYYSLTDQNPIFGINYYRLRSIDFDGSVQRSNIVSVQNEPTLRVSIAPNPFVNKITVSSSESIIKAVLFMPNGSQNNLNLHQLGSYVEIEINQNLSAGVYILSLENLKNQIVKYRLVKE